MHKRNSAIDIFTFGMLLWEILPRRGFSVLGNSTICSSRFPIGTPPGLRTIIEECLQPLPMNRPSIDKVWSDLLSLSSLSIADHPPITSDNVLCDICLHAMTPITEGQQL